MHRWIRSTILVVLLVAEAAQAAPRLRAVTVLGRPNDPRVAAVQSAVAYWNEVLAQAGMNERLAVTRLQPNKLSLDYFRDVARGLQRRSAPPETDAIDGDLVVALVDAEFISYAVRMSDGRRFIALRTLTSRALSQPGVAENLAAHEIGHSLGLRHNSDPNSLMCGAPAACRPARYAAAAGAIFPLSAADRSRLAARAQSRALSAR